jgi:hypothetical protein
MKISHYFCLFLFFLAGCSSAARNESELVREFREIASPASLQSGQPYLIPGNDGTVYLSWIEPGTVKNYAFRYSRLTGDEWTESATIIEGDDLFVNWADVPSIFEMRDGILAAHWLESSGEWVYAYDVRVSATADGGVEWSEPVSPHRDGTKTEHGFASMFNHPGGGLGVVWLDGREAEAAEATAGHAAHSGDWNMHLRSTILYTDGSLGPEQLLDGMVCECCPTATAETENGIVVAYRSRTADEIRDIYIVRFEDGIWSGPYPVHADGWNIAGCPVNGPALSSIGNDVAIAWYTAAHNDARVYVAFSHDGGRTFTPPHIVNDDIPLGRVAVEILDDGSALVMWIENADEDAGLMIRRIYPDGIADNARKIAVVNADRSSGYPRMVRHDDRLVFAWVDTFEASRVRTAVAQLGEK